MESTKTHERTAITEGERESLHQQLAAANMEIEEMVDTSVEPAVKVTMLPHQEYISQRARLARAREKAHRAQLQQQRKQARARGRAGARRRK